MSTDIANALVIAALTDTEGLTADNSRLRRQLEDQREQLEEQERRIARLRLIIATQDAELRRLTREPS